MASVKPSWLLAGLSGSIGKHDRIYVRQNKHSGKIHTAILANPYQGEPTEKQVKNRNKFGIIAHAVCEWIKAEKAKDNGMGSIAYNKVLAEFYDQHDCGTLRSYITHKYATFDAETQTAQIAV